MIQPIVRHMQGPGSHRDYVVWPDVTAGEECAPVQVGQFAFRSVHVYGTFAKASAALHGSNESPNEATDDASGVTQWCPLHDAQGVEISCRGPAIDSVQDGTNWLKPVITNGGADQSVTVAMLFWSHS